MGGLISFDLSILEIFQRTGSDYQSISISFHRNAWEGEKNIKIDDEEVEKLLNCVQEKQLKFDINRVED